MRGWVVLMWALFATLVLIVVGIFVTLIISGRIALAPEPTPTITAPPVIAPVVDTSYQVMILNATPTSGLATQLKDTVVAAGWQADAVHPGDAGSSDFPLTTVFYVLPEDEAAALGLADVIGGAEVAQDDAYQSLEPGTKQLTIVIGLDRVPAGEDPDPTE